MIDNNDFPSKLLQYGLTFLENPKPIIHSESSGGLVSQTTKKDSTKVFAGDLILAKDTVCYLGELARFKKDTFETLKSGDCELKIEFLITYIFQGPSIIDVPHVGGRGMICLKVTLLHMTI